MPRRAKSSSKKVGYFMANVARFYFFIDQENPKIMLQKWRLKGVVSCRGVLAPSHLSGAIWLPFFVNCDNFNTLFPQWQQEKFHSEYSNQQKEGASFELDTVFHMMMYCLLKETKSASTTKFTPQPDVCEWSEKLEKKQWQSSKKRKFETF